LGGRAGKKEKERVVEDLLRFAGGEDVGSKKKRCRADAEPAEEFTKRRLGDRASGKNQKSLKIQKSKTRLRKGADFALKRPRAEPGGSPDRVLPDGELKREIKRKHHLNL